MQISLPSYLGGDIFSPRTPLSANSYWRSFPSLFPQTAVPLSPYFAPFSPFSLVSSSANTVNTATSAKCFPSFESTSISASQAAPSQEEAPVQNLALSDISPEPNTLNTCSKVPPGTLHSSDSTSLSAPSNSTHSTSLNDGIQVDSANVVPIFAPKTPAYSHYSSFLNINSPSIPISWGLFGLGSPLTPKFPGLASISDLNSENSIKPDTDSDFKDIDISIEKLLGSSKPSSESNCVEVLSTGDLDIKQGEQLHDEHGMNNICSHEKNSDNICPGSVSVLNPLGGDALIRPKFSENTKVEKTKHSRKTKTMRKKTFDNVKESWNDMEEDIGHFGCSDHLHQSNGYEDKPVTDETCPESSDTFYSRVNEALKSIKNIGFEVIPVTENNCVRFKCSICDELFKCHTSCSRHSVVHMDYKPYVCEACGIGFTRLDTLKRHVRRKRSRSSHLMPMAIDNLYRYKKGERKKTQRV